MEAQDRVEPEFETTIREMESKNGHLVVYTKKVRGVKVLEAFTLESLAECMGMSMSTMEGRYQRGKLKYISVGIPTGKGRPARGFPLELLTEVVRIISTPGLAIKRTASGESFPHGTRETGPLTPTIVDGKSYFTSEALAEHFGVSTTTVRNRLKKAGLARRMVALPSGNQGGRRRHGLPESQLGNAKLAIVDGESFATELDQMLLRGMGIAAKDDMRQRVTARTFEMPELAPVVRLPVNPVNSRPMLPNGKPDLTKEEVGQLGDDLFADITRIMTNAAASPIEPEEPPPHQEVRSEGHGPALKWAAVPGEYAQQALDATWMALVDNARDEATASEYADWRENMKAAGVLRESADAMIARVKAHWAGEQP